MATQIHWEGRRIAENLRKRIRKRREMEKYYGWERDSFIDRMNKEKFKGIYDPIVGDYLTDIRKPRRIPRDFTFEEDLMRYTIPDSRRIRRLSEKQSPPTKKCYCRRCSAY